MTEQAKEATTRVIRKIVDRRSPVLRRLFADSAIDGGKRLRARLFFDFSESCRSDAVKVASAIELFHAATLIHDDVLDESPVRRGRQALHARRGIPVSVLYGDYLVSEGFSLLAEVGNRLLWREAASALSETLKGEVEEQHRRGDAALRKDEYLSIVRKKSGALFGLACKAGLIMRGFDGRLDERLAERAYGFGLSIGAAYQILDDCADYLGPDGGKARFSDIKGGVITLPLIYLLERSSSDERNFILKILEKPSPAGRDFGKIAALMKGRRIDLDCFKDARDILASAKNKLMGKSAARGRRWFEIAEYIEGKIYHAGKKYCDTR